MIKKKKENLNETYMQMVLRRFRAHHLAKISLGILVVVGLAALFAPVVAPYDPDAIVGTFSGAPCKEFILGTDQIGRDVFSRLLYATAGRGDLESLWRLICLLHIMRKKKIAMICLAVCGSAEQSHIETI